jgi:hypothetical protein
LGLKVNDLNQENRLPAQAGGPYLSPLWNNIPAIGRYPLKWYGIGGKIARKFRFIMFRSILLALAGAIVLSAMLTFSACHSPTTGEADTTYTSMAKRRDLPTFTRNPEFRTHINKEPVAEYKVRTDNPLNDMYFSVRLYETPATMKYLAKVDFEGLTGEDTIKLPDIGLPPHPVLQKGPERYSCIIGLQDNNKAFRELKKVYVTDKEKELKITTLKHYVVTEGYRLVAQ